MPAAETVSAAHPGGLPAAAQRRWNEMIFVAALCAVFFFYGLNAWGFLWPDDSTYAQVAREMMDRHDWVTPTLHGQPWLEKPILYYWLAIASFKLFGVNDGAARIPAALAATFLVFAIHMFLLRVHPRARLDGALVAASSVAMFVIARTASMDMLLTTTLTIALLSWWLWLQERRRAWLLLMYAALGFGVLAKGPVALGLAGLIILAFLLLRRRQSMLREIGGSISFRGIAIFLLIAAPWYWLVQHRNAEFGQEFLFVHNLVRFQKSIILERPWWFFIPLLPMVLLPWTAVVLAGAAKPIDVNAAKANDDLRWFLLIWAVLPVVFFSLSKSKLPHYILPTVPAWVMFAALRMAGRREVSRSLAGWHALLLAAGSAVLYLLPQGQLQWGTEAPPHFAIAIAAAMFVVMLPLLWRWFAKSGIPALRAATTIALIAGVLYTVHVIGPVLEQRFSVRGMAKAFAPIDDGRSTIATYDVFLNVENGMTFYRNVPTRRVELSGVPDTGGYLFVRERSADKLATVVDPRRLTAIGAYAPLHVRWYRVAPLESH